jgi:hypothetical protein
VSAHLQVKRYAFPNRQQHLRLYKSQGKRHSCASHTAQAANALPLPVIALLSNKVVLISRRSS